MADDDWLVEQEEEQHISDKSDTTSTESINAVGKYSIATGECNMEDDECDAASDESKMAAGKLNMALSETRLAACEPSTAICDSDMVCHNPTIDTSKASELAEPADDKETRAHVVDDDTSDASDQDQVDYLDVEKPSKSRLTRTKCSVRLMRRHLDKQPKVKPPKGDDYVGYFYIRSTAPQIGTGACVDRLKSIFEGSQVFGVTKTDANNRWTRITRTVRQPEFTGDEWTDPITV
jgi:hypothetical protein